MTAAMQANSNQTTTHVPGPGRLRASASGRTSVLRRLARHVAVFSQSPPATFGESCVAAGESTRVACGGAERRRHGVRIAAVLAGFLATLSGLTTAPVCAEPPSTSYMFPAGGQRGTQVAVRIGGHYLHDRANFEMLGPGVTAPSEIVETKRIWFEGPLVKLPASQRQEDYPRDYVANVSLAADAPPGARYWRAWNAQGATAARKFLVGDLPETVEQEIDGDPLPTPVKYPATINGRIFPREDVDVWTFDAPAGASLTAAVVAATLGSPLEARIEIRDPDGRPLAEATAPTGQDPLLHFTTAKAGVHELRIHDARYEGLQNFVYRVTLTDAPWIDSVYPLGGRRGADLAVRGAGRSLLDAPLTTRIPPDAADSYDARFDVGGRMTNSVVLATGDLAETLEVEPNDSPEQAAGTTVAQVANGRIDRPGDVDVWSVELDKGAAVVCDIAAARFGSPLDSRLVIRDAAGKELARGDDGPAGVPDAQLTFTAPAAGKYFVAVSERFAGRGGPTFAYRLTIGAPPPAVRLELAGDVVSVDRGAQQKLAVNVLRFGGFNAPVTLAVAGLPAGVTAPDVQVAANQNKGELVFKAETNAPIDVARLKLLGRYELAGKMIEQPIAVARRAGEPPLDSVLLAVTLPTPFKFQGAYELVYIPCGAVSRKRYAIERNGYVGPLVVQLADKQNRHLQGVTGPTIAVPADASEFVYPISLPPWMELGRTSRVVLMATGEVDDGTGRKHKVCFTSGDQNNQMVNLVSPSPLRVTLDRATATAKPGGQLSVEVTLRRDPSIQSAAHVELAAPSHLQGVAADPIEIPAGSSTGRLTLRFGDRPGPFNMPVLIRATAKRGDDPLVAESLLELVPAP